MLHCLLYPKLIQILLMIVEVKQHTNANTMNAGTQVTQKIIQTTQLQESIKFLNKINLLKEKRKTNMNLEKEYNQWLESNTDLKFHREEIFKK